MRRPTLSGLPPVIRPQPICGLDTTVGGLRLLCGLPADHVPAENHETRLKWTAPRVSVQPGERPVR